jgi:aryl-alcohol dehydrogenase-like predicted oxidoreductase
MKRVLGKSGIEVSALGMGCWAIGGPWTWDQPGNDPFPAGWGHVDDGESERAIRAALDAGVNFFDTAANYGAGHSELVLGKALEGRRHEVVIASKFGHIIDENRKVVYADNDKILANLHTDIENSLRRLNTDYIDIFQLHEARLEHEPALELRGMLEDLVHQGLIRWYGWSTDLVDRAMVFADGEHCTSIQFQLNALFDNLEMRTLCKEHNLAGVNKDPLNRGVLTGKFSQKSTFPSNDIRSRVAFGHDSVTWRLDAVEAIKDVLRSGGRTMAQGALAFIWALDENMIPIPGFKSVAQVEQNASAMSFGPLAPDELTQIQAIVDAHRPQSSYP